MMDGSVATKEDDGISLLDQRGPSYIGGTLEFGEGLRHVSRPKNRSSAHAAVLNHRASQRRRNFSLFPILSGVSSSRIGTNLRSRRMPCELDRLAALRGVLSMAVAAENASQRSWCGKQARVFDSAPDEDLKLGARV